MVDGSGHGQIGGYSAASYSAHKQTNISIRIEKGVEPWLLRKPGVKIIMIF
jgi:hypothetical protein